MSKIEERFTKVKNTLTFTFHPKRIFEILEKEAMLYGDSVDPKDTTKTIKVKSSEIYIAQAAEAFENFLYFKLQLTDKDQARIDKLKEEFNGFVRKYSGPFTDLSKADLTKELKELSEELYIFSYKEVLSILPNSVIINGDEIDLSEQDKMKYIEATTECVELDPVSKEWILIAIKLYSQDPKLQAIHKEVMDNNEEEIKNLMAAHKILDVGELIKNTNKLDIPSMKEESATARSTAKIALAISVCVLLVCAFAIGADKIPAVKDCLSHFGKDATGMKKAFGSFAGQFVEHAGKNVGKYGVGAAVATVSAGYSALAMKAQNSLLQHTTNTQLNELVANTKYIGR